MPRLSCIIPVVGSTHGLESTLISVLEQRPEGCEIIVALNTRYDDPYQLKDEIRFLEAPGSSWVNCATLAIRVSRAPIVHLLAAGCEVTPGWADAAMRHFARPEIAAVAPVIYGNDASGGVERPVLAAGVEYHAGGRRTISTSLPPGEGAAAETLGPTFDAAFYRKSALEQVADGLPAVLGDTLADVDLALIMRWAGYRAVVEPACEIHAPGILENPTTAYRSSLFAERLFWRNLPGTNRALGLLAHAAVVAGDLASGVVRGTILSRLAGRIRGMTALDDYNIHRQWLRVLREPPPPERDAAESRRLAGGIRIDAPHATRRQRPAAAQTPNCSTSANAAGA